MIKLYGKYLSLNLKSQLQYKVSFLMLLGGQFIASFSFFVGVYFLMNRFHQIADFAYSDVLICFSIMIISFSLAECFARSFDLFPNLLANGQFDRILMRPQNVVFQIFASNMDFSRLGKLVQAMIIFIYALSTSDITFSLDKIFLLGSMVLCGAITFSALFVIYGAFSFFTVQGLEFMNIFTDGGREFGKYPFSVYGKSVLRFFTYIVPLALFQYYPLLYLIGRDTRFIHFVSPYLSLLFLFPTFLFWKFGVRKYNSTGS